MYEQTAGAGKSAGSLSVADRRIGDGLRRYDRPGSVCDALGNTFLNGTALFCIIRILLGGIGVRSVAAKPIDISVPAKTPWAVLKQ